MHNILHITNEITKKNFSISSLINYISYRGKKNNIINSNVLCSDADNSNIISKKNLIITKIKWLNIYKFKKIFSELSNTHDVIHVHGIWAPIQIYSIIFSILNSKNISIHSHGMLLLPAINGGGFLKKIFKKIFLICLRVLISNNFKITFIAITNEEYDTIKLFFPNAKIILIPNNIPFKSFLNFEKNFEFKKKFVFFGRIHPHKNILSLIEIFKNSNLMSNGWSLEIYGIEDDKNYLKKIIQEIEGYPKIKLLKPVFGLQKAKIIRSAWANILVSKSEVLSFSVLESGIYGLTSIVSDNIETLKDDKLTSKVKNDSTNIVNKIIEVSNWSQQKRGKIGQKTSNFFTNYKNKSESLFLKSLNNLYESLISTKFKRSKVSLESFYVTSVVHSLNVFLPNIILFLSFIAFDSKVAAEIGITNITFITLTQMLSGNIRLISVKEQDINLLRRNLFFRLIFGIFILSVFQILSYNLEFIEQYNTTFLISTLIILLWCSELALSIFEIKRDIIKLILSLFFYLIFIISLCVFFFFKNIILIHGIIFISICGLFLFCIRSIDLNLDFYKNFKKLFGKKTSIKQYLSSISSPLSSMSWRFYLYFTYPKEISGTIFIAFAICSFPGTFFNSVLGPNYFYNRISVNPRFKNFFISLLTLIVFYNILTYESISNLILSENNLFFHTLKVSAVGSLIMIYAMYYRQNDFFTKKNNSVRIFNKDIFYGIGLVLILPALDRIGGLDYVVYSYTLGACIAVLVFNEKIRLKNYNYVPSIKTK